MTMLARSKYGSSGVATTRRRDAASNAHRSACRACAPRPRIGLARLRSRAALRRRACAAPDRDDVEVRRERADAAARGRAAKRHRDARDRARRPASSSCACARSRRSPPRRRRRTAPRCARRGPARASPCAGSARAPCAGRRCSDGVSTYTAVQSTPSWAASRAALRTTSSPPGSRTDAAEQRRLGLPYAARSPARRGTPGRPPRCGRRYGAARARAAPSGCPCGRSSCAARSTARARTPCRRRGARGVVGRKVDDHHLVGVVEERVGHGLPHA